MSTLRDVYFTFRHEVGGCTALECSIPLYPLLTQAIDCSVLMYDAKPMLRILTVFEPGGLSENSLLHLSSSSCDADRTVEHNQNSGFKVLKHLCHSSSSSLLLLLPLTLAPEERPKNHLCELMSVFLARFICSLSSYLIWLFEAASVSHFLHRCDDNTAPRATTVAWVIG